MEESLLALSRLVSGSNFLSGLLEDACHILGVGSGGGKLKIFLVGLGAFLLTAIVP